MSSKTPKKRAVKRPGKAAKRTVKRPTKGPKRKSKKSITELTDAQVIRKLFPAEVVAKANAVIGRKPKRST